MGLWEDVPVVCFQVICPDVSFASMSGLSIDLNHNADIFLAKVSLLPYIPLLFLSFLFSSSGRTVSPATLLLRIFDNGDTIGAPSFCRAVLSGKGFRVVRLIEFCLLHAAVFRMCGVYT